MDGEQLRGRNEEVVRQGTAGVGREAQVQGGCRRAASKLSACGSGCSLGEGSDALWREVQDDCRMCRACAGGKV